MQLVHAARCPGLDKSRALNELQIGVCGSGQLAPSPTAKFFILKAAIGDQFVFRYGDWVYPADTPENATGNWTVLRGDGSVGTEPITLSCVVATNNPWRPVRGRSAYKKAELVAAVQQITGDSVPHTVKADALYTQLFGRVTPLPQAN